MQRSNVCQTHESRDATSPPYKSRHGGLVNWRASLPSLIGRSVPVEELSEKYGNVLVGVGLEWNESHTSLAP